MENEGEQPTNETTTSEAPESLATTTTTSETTLGGDQETPGLDLSAVTEAAKTESADQGDQGEDGQTEEAESTEPVDLKALELPDGYTIRDEDLEVFGKFAEKYKLDAEGAQGLVNLSIAVQEAATKEAVERTNAQAAEETAALQAKWQKDLSEHPELGGENMEKTQNNLNALERSGVASKEAIAMLKDTGILFFPPITAMLNAFGQSTQEDPISFGSSVGGSQGGDRAANMFANSGHK